MRRLSRELQYTAPASVGGHRRAGGVPDDITPSSALFLRNTYSVSPATRSRRMGICPVAGAMHDVMYHRVPSMDRSSESS